MANTKVDASRSYSVGELLGLTVDDLKGSFLLTVDDSVDPPVLNLATVDTSNVSVTNAVQTLPDLPNGWDRSYYEVDYVAAGSDGAGLPEEIRYYQGGSGGTLLETKSFTYTADALGTLTTSTRTVTA